MFTKAIQVMFPLIILGSLFSAFSPLLMAEGDTGYISASIVPEGDPGF